MTFEIDFENSVGAVIFSSFTDKRTGAWRGCHLPVGRVPPWGWIWSLGDREGAVNIWWVGPESWLDIS